MTGPINVFDAIVHHMPTAVYTDLGTSVPITWQPRMALPRGASNEPRTYPYGTFEILDTQPLPRSAAPGETELSLTSQADAIAFSTGTLTYLLSQWDLHDIQSVTGTVGGLAHTFVQGTDYEAAAPDSILWLGATLPDNATNFTVTYRHKLYARMWQGRSNIVVRTFLYVKDGTFGGRQYAKEVLAALLGESLEHQLRRKGGTSLYKPPGTSTPHLRELQAGPVLLSRPGITDESQSMAIWVIDFRLHRHRRFPDAAVPAILTAEVEVDEVGQ